MLFRSDKKNFIELCPSCHRKYDFLINKKSKALDMLTGLTKQVEHWQSKLEAVTKQATFEIMDEIENAEVR